MKKLEDGKEYVFVVHGKDVRSAIANLKLGKYNHLIVDTNDNTKENKLNILKEQQTT